MEVGGRLVVESADFTIMPRDTVGLVGRNGAGKTSLLRVLGGEVEAAAGRVVRRGAFGYLPQDPRIAGMFDGRRAVAHVLSGRGIDEEQERIEKLRIAMEERPDERNVARYTRAEELFRTNGGYAADSEARALAAGLGIGPDRIDLPVGVLSGGERRRVELARILFAGSEVLCLDEPTNHLDVDAKEWLMAFLRSYRGALLVISHDLDLLDEAITRILHLDRVGEDAVGHLVEYKGTYSQYLAARAPDEEQHAKLAARQAKQKAKMQRFFDRFGAKATKAAAAHNMEKRIARLEAEQVEERRGDRVLRVKFPPPPAPGRTVIKAAGLAKSYTGPPVFEDVSFDLGRGERLLVLGLNGAGKTSLLRILAGELGPDRGLVSFGHNVTVGYYAQEHDNLRIEESLLENLRREVPNEVVLSETQLRGLVGMMGLSGEKVYQEAGTLSGGEKTKLALAMLMVGRNNLLLLDEPTNNLDPASRRSVSDALVEWPGAVIFVSHDTEFVEQLAPTKVLLMPDGDLDYFNPNWLDLVALA
ncbi:MAG: ABC-F family ATP-binding cassette domain-containing protein [Ilumatobacteraceae bacterium]